MKKKKTITVGIAAYNEEANIENVISDVLIQKTNRCVLDKIIVISDGSTDRTNSIVKSIKSKKLRLIIGKTRQGKATRVNYLLHNLTSDYLFLLDADVKIASHNTLDAVCKLFEKNANAGIVQTNVYPIKGKTFIEKAINNYFYSRNSINNYKFGTTVYGARAAGMAISKPLAHITTLPVKIINDDSFLYFTCKFSGFKFIYADKIEVLYRSPQNLKDLYNQTFRYAIGEKQIHEYFNRPETYKAYSVSHKVLIQILVKQLLRNPIGYSIVKIVNSAALIKLRIPQASFNHKWVSVLSTKAF